MNLPFKSLHQATPELEEILSQLPFDTVHFDKLSLLPDAEARAKHYADHTFETQFGDEIEQALGHIETLKREVARREQELEEAQDYLHKQERKLNLGNAEESKPPMSVTTIGIQVALLFGFLAVVFLGANSIATLLISVGEPYLTDHSKAYLLALTGPFAFAILLECTINLARNDSTKSILLWGVIVAGISSGVAYFALLSHNIPAEFSSSNDVAPLIGNPGTPTSSTQQSIIDSGFFGKSGQRWFLFFQLLMESAGVCLMLHFFATNLKTHRSAAKRNDPEYLRAEQAKERAAELRNKTKAELDSNHAFLRSMGNAKEMHAERVCTHVEAMASAMRMILTRSHMAKT
jgi:hypothetical protein